MEICHHSFFAMGTRFALVLPGADLSLGQAFADAVEATVRRLEHRLSRFDPEGTVYRINREAHRTPVAVEEEVWNVLRSCQRYHTRTRGAFDITLYPLLAFWRARGRAGVSAEPAVEEVEAVRAQTGMAHVVLEEEGRVRLGRADAEIDLGGFGKGYALERVWDLLEDYGMSCAFISFGESAVLVRGHHPHGTGWIIGIEHLFEKGKSAYSFSVRDQSVSTSGATPGNRPVKGAPYGHVISPFTGFPVTGYRTVSVVAASPLDAEVLSTALLVTPREDRAAILDGFPGCRAVELAYDEEARVEQAWTYRETI